MAVIRSEGDMAGLLIDANLAAMRKALVAPLPVLVLTNRLP
jgi:hypothetical protein